MTRVGIIGGGPAGYFAAIRCAETHRDAEVVILEATHRPLLKVLISGGGRCNVTHNCFDPVELVKGYPRGYQELRGPFSRFQPRDTVAWFESRGVRLKAEPDGRMFPVTDRSSDVAECLQRAAADAGVKVHLGSRIKGLTVADDGKSRHFEIHFKDGGAEQFNAVLLGTGSTPSGYKMAASLGHTITPLAPSLFTFTIRDTRLEGLAGISVPTARVRLEVGEKGHFEQTGPVLITHWGLSGPAVLKLSAWAARELLRADYQARLVVSWIPERTLESLQVELTAKRVQNPRKQVAGDGIEPVPRRLWRQLVAFAGIDGAVTWSNVTREQMHKITEQLVHGSYAIIGKGEFKDEFVTCGGVALKEIDFRTMESKICPGLYFAGEILDIDGITGGYNFQSAWTTGWIAGGHMAS